MNCTTAGGELLLPGLTMAKDDQYEELRSILAKHKGIPSAQVILVSPTGDLLVKEWGCAELRGPVLNDFSMNAACGLPAEQEEWNFFSFADPSSVTVCLELLSCHAHSAHSIPMDRPRTNELPRCVRSAPLPGPIAPPPLMLLRSAPVPGPIPPPPGLDLPQATPLMLRELEKASAAWQWMAASQAEGTSKCFPFDSPTRRQFLAARTTKTCPQAALTRGRRLRRAGTLVQPRGHCGRGGHGR